MPLGMYMHVLIMLLRLVERNASEYVCLDVCLDG